MLSLGGQIECPAANCSAQVPVGSSITLIPMTTGPGQFRGWVGPCSGLPNCTVQADQAESVQAIFSVWSGNREIREGTDLNEATGIVFANGAIHVAMTLNRNQPAVVRYSPDGTELGRMPVVRRELARVGVFPDGTTVIAGHVPNNSDADLIGYSVAGNTIWNVPLGRQADSFTPVLNQGASGFVWVGETAFPGGWSVFRVDALGATSDVRGGEVGDNANRFSDFVPLQSGVTVISGSAIFPTGIQRPFVQRAVQSASPAWTYTPIPTDVSIASSVALDAVESSYVILDARPVELIKFDASGQEVWRRTIAGALDGGGARSCDLQIDPALGFVSFSAGRTNVYAYSLDGDLLWGTGSGAALLYGVAIDDQGFVYAAGRRYEGMPSEQNTVAVVAKFDHFGNRL